MCFELQSLLFGCSSSGWDALLARCATIAMVKAVDHASWAQSMATTTRLQILTAVAAVIASSALEGDIFHTNFTVAESAVFSNVRDFQSRLLSWWQEHRCIARVGIWISVTFRLLCGEHHRQVRAKAWLIETKAMARFLCVSCGQRWGGVRQRRFVATDWAWQLCKGCVQHAYM